MKRIPYIALLAGCLLHISCISCSKDGGNDLPGNLSGKLLYEFGTRTFRFDLQTASKSDFFAYNSYSLNGWDVSQDGKILLTSEIVAGSTDVTKYTLSNLANGSIISQFDYHPEGGERDNRGQLSPDNTLIAIKPTADQGIIIVNTTGNVLHTLNAVNGERIRQHEDVVWLPGNSLVFTFNKFILRTDPPYTSITSIKEMNYTEWGGINASPDGRKLSLRIDKHIYLMDIDGKNLTQVTESNSVLYEREAVFSPDGKYLLVGTDWTPRTNDQGMWSLKIIPADGKKYDVDSESSQVVSVVAKGESNIEQCSDIMLWR